MSATAPTHAHVKSLLEHSAYNPAIVPQLQAYVVAQVRSLASKTPAAPYFFDANRTLLKLYQFFPHLADDDAVSLVLLLSLLEFPSTDFPALCFLVPERARDADLCAALSTCAELLEGCRFREFWAAYFRISKDRADPVAEVDLDVITSLEVVDKLRTSIWKIFALAYLSAPLEVLLHALHFEKKSEFEDFARRNQEVGGAVEVLDDRTVTFVASQDNTKRNRVFQEGVKINAIANMMAKATVAKE